MKKRLIHLEEIPARPGAKNSAVVMIEGSEVDLVQLLNTACIESELMTRMVICVATLIAERNPKVKKYLCKP